MKISDQFANDEDQAIRDMANAWSDSLNQATQFMDAAYVTPELNSLDMAQYEDSVIGVYKMSAWPSALPATALAVTQLIGVRKNIGRASEYIDIQHADILVNYDYFAFSTDNTEGYDLQTIVLHEMGHLLGLYHDNSSVEESVMYPSITRSVENRAPKERDVRSIETLYGVSRSGSFNNNHAIAGNSSLQEEGPSADEEVVVIQFELMADGSENIKML